MMENVHWLGHASIKITGEKVIYIDPYELDDGQEADIILVTHGHYDHLSVDDIEKIRGDKTVVVVPVASMGSVSGNVKGVHPGDKLTVKGIKIRAVPAYNIDKRFHPKEGGFVGYVFTVNGVTYYHAGDTDCIPEMKSVEADVVFLPVGGTYTMTAEEAAEAVKLIRPKVAVPMHWGSIVGSRKDAEEFRELCDCTVHILTLDR